MANLFFFIVLACHQARSSFENPNIVHPPASIGTPEAREYILKAYLAQYDLQSEASMEAFAKARAADPTCHTILLLWGDSAWEQGLKEKARWAWKEYQQTLSPNDRTEIELITQRLEQS